MRVRSDTRFDAAATAVRQGGALVGFCMLGWLGVGAEELTSQLMDQLKQEEVGQLSNRPPGYHRPSSTNLKKHHCTSPTHAFHSPVSVTTVARLSTAVATGRRGRSARGVAGR